MSPESDIRLRAIIVDDEWLMREELRSLIDKYPQIEVTGEAESVSQAVTLIGKQHPDVVFLDIQMPGESGFDLVNNYDISCSIVFVTAYDEYAIKAFEINAVDYLLKPIQPERLDKTIDRLLIRGNDLHTTPKRPLAPEDVLYLNIDNSYKFIKISTIKCILAESNYSYLIAEDGKKKLVCKTLKEWEDILPENHFKRIHRSTIINIDDVEKIRQCKNYTNLVYLKGIAEPFEMSRRYAARFRKQ